MIDSAFTDKKTTPLGRQTGFSLVDILVGLAMASVLMVAMVSLFTTMGRSYTCLLYTSDAADDL